MTFKILLSLLLLTLALPQAAFADSWPQAEIREVFSQNRDFMVRVIPGNNAAELYKMKPRETTHDAAAEFYKRRADKSYEFLNETALKNPIAPAKFFVTDEGYLVTVDNWQNLGYGAVITAYSHDGILKYSLTLQDVFSPQEIEKFLHSVSSIHWIDSADIDPQQVTLHINVKNRLNGTLTILIKGGSWKYCETRKEGYSCRTGNENREWKVMTEKQAGQ